MKRQVILRSDPEDGGWIAEVPSLPGCVSQGETRSEALENARDAVFSWISVAKTTGRNIPPEVNDAEIVEISEKM